MRVPQLRFSFASILGYLQGLGRVKQVISVVVAIAVVGILISVLRSDVEETVREPRTPLVEVATVLSLSSDKASLPILGRVQSQTEATILTEAQGQIVRVNYELGDFISAGAIIAEISNASERASVAQAQAALAELESQSARSRTTTYSEAANAYRSAFITADDAILSKTEPFFTNDRSQFPQLLLAVISDEELEEGRAAITDILRDWESDLESFTTGDDILPLLAQAREDLSFIETFLNNLTNAANRQTDASSAISITDTDRANLQAGRTAVSSELDALISIENDLRQTLPGDAPGGTGELESQIQVAEASVSAAFAALEKTIVRAPISGTINMLELERGDFVGTFEEVVTIANNNALEVEAFITEGDRTGIAVGNSAIIDGEFQGVITRIAPALDPQTKKIEVKIGIEDENAELTSGESVEVLIERGDATFELPEEGPFPIPVSALKITSTDIIVFTVGAENKLVPHSVTVGSLVGEKIFVESGLTPEMEIVLDARGLKEGQEVSTNAQ